jgi:heme-degrading monooxygenase HmoA
MIYEIALFPVYGQHIEAFIRAFAEVAPLLSRAKGCDGHLLAQGIETPELLHLIVRAF